MAQKSHQSEIHQTASGVCAHCQTGKNFSNDTKNMSVSIINFIFTGLFLFGAVMLWHRARRLRQKISWEEPGASTLLRISVPKNNERTPQAAEQMFAAMHGIFRSSASRQPHVSFEIVSKARTINFYTYVPTELRDFVSSQIFAQYPTVEITEIEPDSDYTTLSDEKQIAATELDLKKPTAFPIKTFQNFEVDPLSSIAGALGSVSEEEEVWVQVLIKPIDDDWQDLGKSEVKRLKDGFKAMSLGQLVKNEFKLLIFGLAKSVVEGPPGEEKKKDDKKKDDKETPETVAIKAIEEKITKLGFATNIRLLAAGNDEYSVRAKLEQVVGAFKQFNTINLNAFVAKDITSDRAAHELFTTRAFGEHTMILNITELASVYHYPSETVATPTIAWAGSKKGEPPGNLPLEGTVPADDLTVFGQTNFRSEVKRFGIKKKDRRLHMYIIGKTGTGKSTLMENMIIDDINEGRGMAVVDPHGSLIQHVLEFIPEHRIQDVIYFNPADHEHPVGFNLLENVDPEQKNIVASGVIGIMEKIFGEVSWGPRLEYILRNVILALLEYPNSTFMGIMRILTDNAYRRLVVNEVKDPVIRDFFINEFEKYEPKFRTEAIAPIQNKVGQFLSASTIRNIVGQPKSTIDIRRIMDEGKILLADLSIGKIGEDNSALLGSMLITKIQLAAMGRVDIAESERRDFYLYVDEFQNFATESFATILSEARKYRLNLAMANQYTAQMPEAVSNAVFGNVGTLISFRVGAQDADVLVKEMEPVFDANDLVNLDNFQIYLKMAIDGVTVPAFSAGTLPPRTEKTHLVDQIIANSRQMYSRPIEEVEDYITEWSSPINLSDPSKQPGPQPYEELKTKPNAFEKNNAHPPIIGAEEQSSPQSLAPSSDKVGDSGEKDRVIEAPQKTEEEGNETAKVAKTEPGRVDLPKGMSLHSSLAGDRLGIKTEIIKDRFDRQWYAVTEEGDSKSQSASWRTNLKDGDGEDGGEEQLSPQSQAPSPSENGGEAAENTQPTIESRGEAFENDRLISWDDAEKLGIQVQMEPSSEPITDADDQGLTPLDEIR
ncbi:MAG: type IV secretion system DNA-binding domain-containing protein [bacterium]|nr:type IV secretion system DNA-binding domain-containing protein [bacterium]